MKANWRAIWREDEGVLSFEWVLVFTLLGIGIVAGLAAARDAVIDELGDIAEGTVAIDQSYTIPGSPGPNGFPEVIFNDQPVNVVSCDRATGP